MSDWSIQIRSTVTVIQTISNRAYPDMTAQQAKDYEAGLSQAEIIQRIIEEVPYALDEDLSVSQEVTIIED
jgi:hypothetical protein